MNIEKNKIKELVKMYFEAYIELCKTKEEDAPSGEYEEYNVQYLRVCDEERILERVLNTLGITMDYCVGTEEKEMDDLEEHLDFYFEEKLAYRIFLWEDIINNTKLKIEEYGI